MSTRFWFTPRPGYDGPPIELVCGRHTKKSGLFIPKNVRLTGGPSRLTRYKFKKAGRRPVKMVGDTSTDEREIYALHIARKREVAS